MKLVCAGSHSNGNFEGQKMQTNNGKKRNASEEARGTIPRDNAKSEQLGFVLPDWTSLPLFAPWLSPDRQQPTPTAQPPEPPEQPESEEWQAWKKRATSKFKDGKRTRTTSHN